MSLLLFACLNLQKEEEPEDPERRVSFEFVCGFLVELVKKETRFRLLYTFLTLLGLQLPDREFSNLVNSAASENYFNHDKIQNQVPVPVAKRGVFYKGTGY